MGQDRPVLLSGPTGGVARSVVISHVSDVIDTQAGLGRSAWTRIVYRDTTDSHTLRTDVTAAVNDTTSRDRPLYGWLAVSPATAHEDETEPQGQDLDQTRPCDGDRRHASVCRCRRQLLRHGPAFRAKFRQGLEKSARAAAIAMHSRLGEPALGASECSNFQAKAKRAMSPALGTRTSPDLAV